MKSLFVSLFFIPAIALMATPARADIRTEIIEYRHGETVLEGYLAYDDEVEEQRPGVMVVHQWKGLGDYEKRRARELAELGYVAFAADIYGKGIRPETSEEAREQATFYRSNRQILRGRANAGLQVLKNHELTLAEKVAAIGYCFGGGTVLELARSGVNIAGVVSFHGNLDTSNLEDANNIRGRVLVLHGADDPLVPPEQVQTFSEEMRSANVDWELVMYGGAVHSFTNSSAGDDPSKGVAYQEAADKRSWTAMQEFFNQIFN
ncbi:MAG: dienelactone hydrolase family protein [Cyanobacteria bacterium P01_E01_bin.42]